MGHSWTDSRQHTRYLSKWDRTGITMSVNKVSMNTLIVQIDDMINQRKCECTQENKRESLVYVSQRVLRLWCASPCVLAGVWLWTRWHIQRSTGWLTVIFMWEYPPAAQQGLCLTGKKKRKKLGCQFGSVHADISDRKPEQGNREKNISIHNGWKSRGSVLNDTEMWEENERREEVYWGREYH